MTVKEHYDNHLGNFYSWMVGDFETKQQDFQQFLADNKIQPGTTQIAVDLGAGHGIQSVALAKLGFRVTAIDFNLQLLNALKVNSQGLPVTAIEDEITTIRAYADLEPELIICWGDTLTHLESKQQIQQFIQDCAISLAKSGKLLLSFRDYSQELEGDNRFIPVKSDEAKILTCFLEYQPETVKVTDLLHEKTETGWEQKVSSYQKVRIAPTEVADMLQAAGLKILFNKPIRRMQTIIAEKL